jgi:hypothetical protein
MPASQELYALFPADTQAPFAVKQGPCHKCVDWVPVRGMETQVCMHAHVLFLCLRVGARLGGVCLPGLELLCSLTTPPSLLYPHVMPPSVRAYTRINNPPSASLRPAGTHKMRDCDGQKLQAHQLRDQQLHHLHHRRGDKLMA